MLKHLVTAAAITAVSVTGALAAGHGDPIKIVATANSNEADEDYAGLIVFKDYVEAASNGGIEVEIFMGTQLCSTGAECIEGVSEGSIDVYISTSGGAAGIFPYVQVLDLPYLMANDRVAEHVLSGDFVRTMRDMALEGSDNTVRLMTVGNTGGWRNFANTQRRIQSPADMDGLKIRTVVADLPQELVKALGASPTPIPWPELFTSFQTGVVDGSKNGITDIMGMKFPDAGLQYVTLDGHAYMGALWWMSNEKFMSLDEAQRRVVVDGFYALQQATFAAPKRGAIEAYAEFTAGGGDIYVPTPEEKAMFAEAALPVQQWFRDNVDGGDQILDALIAAVADAEADLSAAYDVDLKYEPVLRIACAIRRAGGTMPPRPPSETNPSRSAPVRWTASGTANRHPCRVVRKAGQRASTPCESAAASEHRHRHRHRSQPSAKRIHPHPVVFDQDLGPFPLFAGHSGHQFFEGVWRVNVAPDGR
jgi:TRAP-type C4-dicarboxylate transport system substrate-binding protein